MGNYSPKTEDPELKKLWNKYLRQIERESGKKVLQKYKERMGNYRADDYIVHGFFSFFQKHLKGIQTADGLMFKEYPFEKYGLTLQQENRMHQDYVERSVYKSNKYDYKSGKKRDLDACKTWKAYDGGNMEKLKEICSHSPDCVIRDRYCVSKELGSTQLTRALNVFKIYMLTHKFEKPSDDTILSSAGAYRPGVEAFDAFEAVKNVVRDQTNGFITDGLEFLAHRFKVIYEYIWKSVCDKIKLKLGKNDYIRQERFFRDLSEVYLSWMKNIVNSVNNRCIDTLHKSFQTLIPAHCDFIIDSGNYLAKLQNDVHKLNDRYNKGGELRQEEENDDGWKSEDENPFSEAAEKSAKDRIKEALSQLNKKRRKEMKQYKKVDRPLDELRRMRKNVIEELKKEEEKDSESKECD